MITAEIPYTLETGEKLVNETFGPNNIRRRRTGTQDMRPVTVHDGREAAAELSLERTGFVLADPANDTWVTKEENLRMLQDSEILRVSRVG